MSSESLALQASDFAVMASANVQQSPAQITLAWPQDTNGIPTSYTVYRKLKNDTAFKQLSVLPGTATSFIDATIIPSTGYEYQIIKNAGGYKGLGHIYAGIELPLVDKRGAVILIVDNTVAEPLKNELQQFQQDLIGDGWQVIRHDVARTARDVDVKALIKADYLADPSHVRSVFLFGHVPIPYLGVQTPDGHNNHTGAYPSDVFYADMDGQWTDTGEQWSTFINPDIPRMSNTPGDGKWDQSRIPSDLELEVGRVDLSNMPGMKNGVATFPSELELLRRYLIKDHAFRHKITVFEQRAALGDNFSGKGYSASAFSAFAAFFGADKITPLPYNNWGALISGSYLWTYACGPGTFTMVGGGATTTGFIDYNLRTAFTMFYGSYFGDWDNEDAFLRAPLTGETYGLTSVWSGYPPFYFHHMALGETVGYSTRITQNYSGLLYTTTPGSVLNTSKVVYLSLMGDPTLRMHVVAPVSNLKLSPSSNIVYLTWLASPDNVVGYHVYRASTMNGPYTRLTTQPIIQTQFTDNAAAAQAVYMVRAIKLEISASGSYYNASQGVFVSNDGLSQGASGDVNGDKDVNITDVLIISQIATGSIHPSADQITAADMNSDGMVNISDVLLIARKAVGL